VAGAPARAICGADNATMKKSRTAIRATPLRPDVERHVSNIWNPRATT